MCATLLVNILVILSQSKTLVACKASNFSESNVSKNIDDQEQYLMTYKEFNSRTTKNKVFMDNYLSYVSVSRFHNFTRVTC